MEDPEIIIFENYSDFKIEVEPPVLDVSEQEEQQFALHTSLNNVNSCKDCGRELTGEYGTDADQNKDYLCTQCCVDPDDVLTVRNEVPANIFEYQPVKKRGRPRKHPIDGYNKRITKKNCFKTGGHLRKQPIGENANNYDQIKHFAASQLRTYGRQCLQPTVKIRNTESGGQRNDKCCVELEEVLSNTKEAPVKIFEYQQPINECNGTTADNNETIEDNNETIACNYFKKRERPGIHSIKEYNEMITENNETIANNCSKKRGRPRKHPIKEYNETIANNIETIGDNIETIAVNNETIEDSIETVLNNKIGCLIMHPINEYNNYLEINNSAGPELKTNRRQCCKKTILLKPARKKKKARELFNEKSKKGDNDHNYDENPMDGICEKGISNDELLTTFVIDDEKLQPTVNCEVVNGKQDRSPKNITMCCQRIEEVLSNTNEVPVKIFECQQPIKKSGRIKKHPINEYNGTTADNNETIEDNIETIADNIETIADNIETIAVSNETIEDSIETVLDNEIIVGYNVINNNNKTLAINSEMITNNEWSINKIGRLILPPINEYNIYFKIINLAAPELKTYGRQCSKKTILMEPARKKDKARIFFNEESKKLHNDHNYAKEPVDGICEKGISNDEPLTTFVIDDEKLQPTVNCEVLNGKQDRSSKNITMVIPCSVTNENDVNPQKLPFGTNVISQAYTTHETERRSTPDLESAPCAIFKCARCPCELATHWQLIRHKTLHDLLPFQCQDCWICFISKLELSLHLCKAKSGYKQTTGMYKCANCPCEFTTYWWLKRHVEMTHQKRSFDSTQCENSTNGMGRGESKFESEEATMRTITDRIDAFPFKCQGCPRAFRFRSQLKQHTHKRNNPSNSITHQIERRETGEPNPIEISDEFNTTTRKSDTSLLCDTADHIRGHNIEKKHTCLKQYKNTEDLTKQTDTVSLPFKCQESLRAFRFRPQLKQHTHKNNNPSKSVTHQIKRRETGEPNPIEISDEFNTTTRKSDTSLLCNTADHVRGHNIEKKRTCLKQHNNTDHLTKQTDTDHIDSLRFKCQKCPRAFRFRSQLKQHTHKRNNPSNIVTHQIERREIGEPNPIEISDEFNTTTRKSDTSLLCNTADHIRGHSIEKKHTCLKQYKNTDNLAKQTDTDSLPFKCQESLRAFRFRPQLKQHTHKKNNPSNSVTHQIERRETGEPNPIEISDEFNTTTRKSDTSLLCNTADHIRGHSIEKKRTCLKHHNNTDHLTKQTDTDHIDSLQFKCQKCPRAFRFRSQLKQHTHKRNNPSNSVTHQIERRETGEPNPIEISDEFNTTTRKSDTSLLCNTADHIRRHNIEKKRTCLKQHNNTDHLTKQTDTDHIDSLRFKCQKCPRAFRFRSQLKQHTHKRNNPSNCVTHQIERHETGEPNPIEISDEFNTTTKKSDTSLLCNTADHIRGHNIEKKHTCLKQYKNTDNLIKQTDTDSLSFKCQESLRAFRFRPQLKQHTHTKNNPSNSVTHRVERCESEEPNPIEISDEFNTADHIQGQINEEQRTSVSIKSKLRDFDSDVVEASVETADRIDAFSFKCEICQRAFTLESQLTNHITSVHRSNESTFLFECLQCPDKFAFGSWLKNCENAVYKSKQTDDTAQITNTSIDGASLYKCANCPCEFATSWWLNRHVKAAHPEFAANKQTLLENSTHGTESRDSNYDVDESHETDNESNISDISFESNTTIKSRERESNITITFGERDSNTTIKSGERQSNVTINSGERDSNTTIKSGEREYNVTITSGERDFNTTIKSGDRESNATINLGEREVETRFQLQLKQHAHKSSKPSNSIVTSEVQYSDSDVVETTIEITDRIDAFPFKCQECPRAFRFQSQLKQHGHKTHKRSNSIFMCQECPRTFAYRSELKSHKAMMQKFGKHELDFRCQKCPLTFKLKRVLFQHLSMIHNIKRVRSYWLKHKNTDNLTKLTDIDHIDSLPFKCQECPRAFRFRSQLKQHTHKRNKPSNSITHRIERCETEEPNPIELSDEFNNTTRKSDTNLLLNTADHIHGHINEERRTALSINSKVGNFDCDIVEASVETADRVDAFPLKCEKCPRAFTLESQLTTHITSVHRSNESTFLFECSQCPDKFAFGSWLKNHENAVHEMKQTDVAAQTTNTLIDGASSYKCANCPGEFATKAHQEFAVDTQMLLENSTNRTESRDSYFDVDESHETDNESNISDISFESNDTIKSVERDSNSTIKFGEREVETRLQSQLKHVHENTAHLSKLTDTDAKVFSQTTNTADMNPNEAMFRCLLCPREFADSHGLERHRDATHQPALGSSESGTDKTVKISNVVKLKQSDYSALYKCPRCQQKFATYPLLEHHEETKHKPDKKESEDTALYKCEKCPHVFQSNASLVRHASVKHKYFDSDRMDDGTFKCRKCHLDFALKSIYMRHFNKFHKSEWSSVTYACDICARMFLSHKWLQRHISTAHSNGEKLAAHQSEVRDEMPNLIQIRRHENASHQSSKCEAPQKIRYAIYKCNYCPRAFRLNQHLLWHVSRVHKTKEKGRLVRKEELQPTLKCLKCPRMFKFERTLAWHNTKIHNNTVTSKPSDCSAPYKCSQCQQKFATYWLLESHEETKHKADKKESGEANESNDATQKLDTDSLYKCEKCPHVFQSNANLVHHASVKHKYFDSDRMEDGTFKCRKCHLDFALKSIYMRHFYTFHKSEWSSVTYACDICARMFLSHKWLQRHISTAHSNGEKLAAHQSEVRDEMPNLIQIRRHENASHHSSKWEAPQKIRYAIYKCNYCPRAFRLNQHLLWHVSRVHKTKEKGRLVRKEELQPTLKCLKCPRMFKFERTLAWHNTKIHNNTVTSKPSDCSAPYKCSQCQQKFATYWLLERHEETKHKADKKESGEANESNDATQKLDTDSLYKCEKCPLVFQSNASLVRHASVKHKYFDSDRMDDGTFKCRKCHLDFALKSIYMRHFNKFHKSEWSSVTYACDICARMFLSHKWLQRHISTAHSNGEKLAAHQSEVRDEMPNLIRLQRHENASHHSLKCEAPQKIRYAIYKCNYCPRAFRLNQHLLWHVSRVHKTKEKGRLVRKEELQPTLKCLKCPRMFKFERTLAWHNTKIHNNTVTSKPSDCSAPYKCSQCQQKFATYWLLERHEETKHKADKKESGEANESNDATQKLDTDSLYKCEKCPLVFQSNASLVRHASVKHKYFDSDRMDDGTFKCRKCHLDFALKSIYMRHFNKFHKSEWSSVTYACDICARMFLSHKWLQRHISTAHSNGEKLAAHQSEVRDEMPNLIRLQRHENASHHSLKCEAPQKIRYAIYKCNYCPRAFRLNQHLLWHVSRVHKTKEKRRLVGKEELQPTLKCFKCPRMFKFERNLARHNTTIHKIRRKKYDYTYIYKCIKCPRKFKYTSQLKHHFNSVHKVKCSKSFECSQCPRKFIYYTGLKNHEKRAHQTNYQSEDNASDNSDVNLSQYVAVTPKPERKDYKILYECEKCPRKFKYAWQFKDHYKRVHKHSKFFECPQCPRKFIYYTGVKNHEKRAHQTKDQTDDNASDDSDVKLSQYVAVTQKPERKEYNIYECEECPQIFKYAWQFKDHFKRVHKVKRSKSFECSQCPRKFIYYIGLKNHEKRAHQTKDQTDHKASGDSDLNLSQYVAVTQKLERKEINAKFPFDFAKCPRVILSRCTDL